MQRSYRKRTRSVFAPVAITSSVNQQTGQRDITLRGREFIQDVVVKFPAGTPGTSTSSQYKVTSTRISPTDGNLFTWLVPIAEKFEEYKFRALAFTYEPQCTTGTTGCVGVFVDPDPTNNAPQSWNTFTNTGVNTHGAVWAKHQLIVPSKYYADRRRYYVADQYQDPQALNPPVRTSAINTTTIPIDPLEYYPGNVGVSTVGVLGPVDQYLTIGKLYMDYVITLSKATIDTNPKTAALGYTNVNGLVPTGRLVSTYFASNAGTGCYIMLQNGGISAAEGTTYALIGTTSASITGKIAGIPQRFGDEVWSWLTNIAGAAAAPPLPAVLAQSQVVATQNQDLMYAVCISGTGLTGAADNVKWRFENQDNNTSTLSTYSQVFDNGNITTQGSFMAVGVLHVVAGERISCTCTFSAGSLLAANCKILLAPMPWGINL